MYFINFLCFLVTSALLFDLSKEWILLHVAFKFHRDFPWIEDNSNAFLIVGSNEGLLEHVTHCGVDHPHYYITALYGKCITRRSYSDVDPRSDPHVSVGDCLSSKLQTVMINVNNDNDIFFLRSKSEWQSTRGCGGKVQAMKSTPTEGWLTLFGRYLLFP